VCGGRGVDEKALAQLVNWAHDEAFIGRCELTMECHGMSWKHVIVIRVTHNINLRVEVRHNTGCY
jgi:hypothetical protein